jgi:hypothetical protein
LCKIVRHIVTGQVFPNRGREIKLFDEDKLSPDKSKRWDIGSYPKNIYFYRDEIKIIPKSSLHYSSLSGDFCFQPRIPSMSGCLRFWTGTCAEVPYIHRYLFEVFPCVASGGMTQLPKVEHVFSLPPSPSLPSSRSGKPELGLVW